MKVAAIAFVAVMMCVGAALADFGYGSYGGSYGGGYGGSSGGYGYGGYSYVPVTGAGGATDGSFLTLIGFLFIFMLLLNGNLFNTTTSGSSTTPITIVQG